uniref:Uncharacterized protein n=1 Tax=Periophthalmus magnuspinnatus TaxID=409849 RepID=A0A3B4B2H8_9GOBI
MFLLGTKLKKSIIVLFEDIQVWEEGDERDQRKGRGSKVTAEIVNASCTIGCWYGTNPWPEACLDRHTRDDRAKRTTWRLRVQWEFLEVAIAG